MDVQDGFGQMIKNLLRILPFTIKVYQGCINSISIILWDPDLIEYYRKLTNYKINAVGPCSR